jgi:LysR family transcriptional regulator, nod-box dependent transcriptional activator
MPRITCTDTSSDRQVPAVRFPFVMDLHGFDLNLLVALDALLAEKSVTNAGRRIHLSQSAMSGVLARLRAVFRDELLVTSRAGMVLTPLAETLVEPVGATLAQVQHSILTHVPFDPPTATRGFAVAASDYAISVLLADFLRQLRECAPSLTVAIVPLRDRMKQLEDAHLDLLIVPKAFVPAGRPHYVLFQDTFSCIAWSSHPTVGSTLTLDQYAALGHVVVSFVDGRLTSFDAHFAADVGLHRRVEVIAPSYQLLPDLVIGTERIATIQTRLARKLAAVRPIKVLPLPVSLPTFEEAMAWHARFDGDDAHRWFRTRLQETAAAMEPADEQTLAPASRAHL